MSHDRNNEEPCNCLRWRRASSYFAHLSTQRARQPIEPPKELDPEATEEVKTVADLSRRVELLEDFATLSLEATKELNEKHERDVKSMALALLIVCAVMWSYGSAIVGLSRRLNRLVAGSI